MKKGVAFILILSAIILLQNCKGKSKTGSSFTETSDTVTFFPVNLYIQGQMVKVDSFATSIYKITIAGNNRDSAAITKQEFRQLAQPFLEYDISSKQLHKFYKENDFIDATTKSIIFNFTAMDSTLPLRSIDVLMDSTGTQLKNIFISKEKSAGDSTIVEKDGWKNGESFFINRSIQKGDNAATMQRTVVVWRF
jgi:hypothetical protein